MWRLICDIEDTQVYIKEDKIVRISRGYAKNGALGTHNKFNTDCLVQKLRDVDFSAEEIEAEDGDLIWFDIGGFDVDGDENGYDWCDYEAKVNDYLTSLK